MEKYILKARLMAFLNSASSGSLLEKSPLLRTYTSSKRIKGIV